MNTKKTTSYTIELTEQEKQELTEALYEVYGTLTDPQCLFSGQRLNWRSNPAKLHELWTKLAAL